MPAEKILIVDDEKLVRWTLRQKCQEWGYQVLEAETGTAGLRLIHSETPDLVLLDVRLPDINGLQVLEQAKQAGEMPRAVIMGTLTSKVIITRNTRGSAWRRPILSVRSAHGERRDRSFERFGGDSPKSY